MFSRAMDLNRRNIMDLLPRQPNARLLDLGCDDGAFTMQLAARLDTRNVWGVEIVPERALQARARGVAVALADLDVAVPFADGSFDVVHANQVIEHVSSVDRFAREVHRILAPGGVLVLSTENGSSWHNVFAAVMGWQIFSLTNLSAHASGVGNPMAVHRGEPGLMTSWTHKTIFNYQGLIEFLRLHGFSSLETRGAGYYPLPAWVGAADVRHAHFLAMRGTKAQG